MIAVGDSGLTMYLAIAAMSVIVVALILAAVAWRVRNRTLRIYIGLGLIVLGLFFTVLSLAGFVLVGGMGVAVMILGVRTRHHDGETH
jgi:hypothetical protein